MTRVRPSFRVGVALRPRTAGNASPTSVCENDSAGAWWHSSTTKNPNSRNVSAGYFRVISVWIMTITKSPDVSHASPWIRVTLAVGTCPRMRSANWSARKFLCTKIMVLVFNFVAIQMARLVLPPPANKFTIAPPWVPRESMIAAAASGWRRSGRRAPTKSCVHAAPGGRTSSNANLPSAQNRGTTYVVGVSAYTLNRLGKACSSVTGATVRSRRIVATSRADSRAFSSSTPRRVSIFPVDADSRY